MRPPKIIAFLSALDHSGYIKLFCGRPLIHWNLIALEGVSEINKIVVATNSQLIKEACLAFHSKKIEIYNYSPLDTEHDSTTEGIIFKYLSSADFKSRDIFVFIQPDSPFITSIDFKNALDQYMQGKYDSIISAVRVKKFFWDDDGNPLNYKHPKRPDQRHFKGTLMETGAFCISSITHLLRHKNFFYGKIGYHEMPEYTSYHLRELHDWEIHKNLMNRYHIYPKIKFKPIKLFASDVDGVLTDSGKYYTNSGDEFKKFNVQDGKGFEKLRDSGILTCIITAEKTNIVERRAKFLKVDFLFQGVKNKLKVMQSLCRRENIQLKEVAYIGDDENDYDLLSKVGLAACPQNAVPRIKSIHNIVHINKHGGDGAVREFIEDILSFF